LLTNMDKARMCCTTAVAADSKPHLEIAEKAMKNIVINGCGNRCASKVMEKAGKRIDYEIDISKYLQKVPTFEKYCPLDGSEHSIKALKALETAVQIAHKFNRKITLSMYIQLAALQFPQHLFAGLLKQSARLAPASWRMAKRGLRLKGSGLY